MFASNQEFKISGEFEDLSMALKFALELSNVEGICLREKRPCKVCFQIFKNNEFCIGKYLDKKYDGWNDFSFDYDVELLALSIIQFLKKQEVETFDGDGTDSKGFLLENISYKDSDNIKNHWVGDIKFSVFNNYYAK